MEYLYKILETLKIVNKPEKEFKKPDGYKNVNSSAIKK